MHGGGDRSVGRPGECGSGGLCERTSSFGQVDVNLRCGFTGPNEAKGGVDAHTFGPSL